MLSSVFRWRSSQSTPQEDFRRLHATLCAPPTSGVSSSTAHASRCVDLAAPTQIVDPYHLIICQHGVLSTSADFDNVITDLFVHHEVSVMEAAELANATAEEAAAQSSVLLHPITITSAAQGVKVVQRGHRIDAVSGVSRTSTPTVTLSTTTTTTTTAAAACSLSCSSTADGKKEMPKASPGSLRPDTALTHAQRTRRDTYKSTFKLAVEYPNKTSGRLYRSGNMRVFSPGSNNYLRSDAGTLACARKMVAETVPQLHVWLDDVEARERQRRAQWSVYARTMNTPEAARLAEEASRPLPVCLSFMAHSFGGIIERESLYLLFVDETETLAQSPVLYDAIVSLRRRLCALNVTFENFLNIATPHCGAGECLWWPIYFGAWCLARLNLCQTYDELILSDAERVLQTRLLDAPHLKVLELFRRRVLFANTHRDLLVGFGTCSLIFENVDTDHTKFVGVTASETHCAAAFADDTVEVSKPIVLKSFAEEAAAERNASPRSRHAAPTTQPRSHTLQELNATSVSSRCAVTEELAPKLPLLLEHNAQEEDEDDAEGTYYDNGSSADTEAVFDTNGACRSAFSRTLRPQPTYSSLSGLTASPTSAVSAAASSSSAAMLQDSAFAVSLTVGHHVPSHAIEEVTLEEVVGAASWCNDGEEEEEEMGSGMLTVVMDPASGLPRDLVASECCSQPCASLSPTLLAERPLSVLRDSPRRDGQSRFSRFSPSSSAGAAVSSQRSRMNGGGSDSDSASSSRRSCGSRVTSVLTDPRWASEHVRHAASAIEGEVRRRLSSAAALVLKGKTGSGEDVAAALPGVVATTTVTESGATTASYLIPADDIPQYRKTPRAIAARLRETLSWRVRAVRFDNVIPVGHVACLGNWAFCGRSHLLVQSVAEELLIVLN